MKKIFLLVLLLPLFIACKDKSEAEPLPQLHFINFVNASGENLFQAQILSTSDFHYGSGSSKETWEDLMNAKRSTIQQVPVTGSNAELISTLAEDEFTLLEVYQGNLERERLITINDVLYTFKFSLENGFLQDGKPLVYSTEILENRHIYLHNVVLEQY